MKEYLFFDYVLADDLAIDTGTNRACGKICCVDSRAIFLCRIVDLVLSSESLRHNTIEVLDFCQYSEVLDLKKSVISHIIYVVYLIIWDISYNLLPPNT
jgi:hypothetical protein